MDGIDARVEDETKDKGKSEDETYGMDTLREEIKLLIWGMILQDQEAGRKTEILAKIENRRPRDKMRSQGEKAESRERGTSVLADTKKLGRRDNNQVVRTILRAKGRLKTGRVDEGSERAR